MKLKKANKILNIFMPFLTILGIFLIWFFASKFIDDNIVLPSPIDTMLTMFKNLGTNAFWISFCGTFSRAIVAFLISFILAFLLAILYKNLNNSRSVIKIIISIVRSLPTIAIVLILLLWTSSKIAAVIVTMLVILPTMFNSIVSLWGIVDLDIIELCNLYKIPKSRQFSSYIFPQILPCMIETVGSGLSLNIKLMVAAEVIASVSNSIGQLMNKSKVYFETAELFALVLIVVIVAVVIEIICNCISNCYRRKHGFKKY